jgi:hypothetical protein
MEKERTDALEMAAKENEERNEKKTETIKSLNCFSIK